MLFSIEKVDDAEWSVDEATEKFLSPNVRNCWKLAFREGVEIDENNFEASYFKKIPEVTAYQARYDLTYITPSRHQLRCKVSWKTTFERRKKAYNIYSAIA